MIIDEQNKKITQYYRAWLSFSAVITLAANATVCLYIFTSAKTSYIACSHNSAKPLTPYLARSCIYLIQIVVQLIF